MDLMARLLKTPRGASLLSAIVSVAAAVAILAFGAPPATLILTSWVTATIYLTLSSPDRR
jgi:hypothetical protein